MTQLSPCNPPETVILLSTDHGPTPIRGHAPCGSRSGLRWYVFQVRPAQHDRAIFNLTRQAFVAWFPLYVHRDGSKAATRALFPGYGFVAFDFYADHWRPIAATLGVTRLFGVTPEMPTPVPRGVVEALMAKRNAVGLIDDGPPPAPLPVAPGARVRISGGAFDEFEGVCSWSTEKRVGLLLETMGGARAVTLPRGIVEVLNV